MQYTVSIVAESLSGVLIMEALDEQRLETHLRYIYGPLATFIILPGIIVPVSATRVERLEAQVELLKSVLLSGATVFAEACEFAIEGIRVRQARADTEAGMRAIVQAWCDRANRVVERCD